MDNRIVFGTGVDPWRNLALESLLFDEQAARGGMTLYLWQNENTVVIGKHQNAWKECRVSLLEEEGGRLARRASGGGAVYHDLGNLNFTFLTGREAYDVRRQLSVIRRAAAAFGIETAFTGRNDLVAQQNGAKFSGNAFRMSGAVGMHHGTILVDVDLQKLGRYLAPSEEKLRAKGVESVRARVCNLAALAPGLTVCAMRDALCAAFLAEYGPAQRVQEAAFAGPALDAREAQYASWEWRMGETPRFDIELGRRFDWGEITLCLSLADGRVENARAYSDAMDEAFVARVAPALIGCPFDSRALAARLVALAAPEAVALADWILEKRF